MVSDQGLFIMNKNVGKCRYSRKTITFIWARASIHGKYRGDLKTKGPQ